jgi:hypothetical protein
MKSATAFGSSLILSFMQLIPSIATKTIAANPGYAALSSLISPAAVCACTPSTITTKLPSHSPRDNGTSNHLLPYRRSLPLIPYPLRGSNQILLHDSIRDTLDDAVPSTGMISSRFIVAETHKAVPLARVRRTFNNLIVEQLLKGFKGPHSSS